MTRSMKLLFVWLLFFLHFMEVYPVNKFLSFIQTYEIIFFILQAAFFHIRNPIKDNNVILYMGETKCFYQ
ncbi:hypothetical protein ATF84_106134 [[Clostridium] innocuum]|nr:hypothetical protein ATF84_106134 [[Clostridium] innocuum]SSA43696.1 hypothetical protein SAMN04487929_106134 [[Clostridium] innocuum]